MLRHTTVEQGRIRGVACENPRVTVYKGIPYARPPVGDLRWKMPTQAEGWEGEFAADQFGPVPYQGIPEEGSDDFYAREHNPCSDDCVLSEDCLRLNVWTPAKTADEKLPVYVWFHGGGLEGCFAWQLELDGESVARKGIVFVSVEYRLNVFGFLAHPALTQDPAAQTNFGLHDCRFALEWIRRNIGAFGGDPDNVTIGGQSAGSNLVLSLITSPLSKGLFAKAIMESGGGLRAYGYATRCMPLAEAEEMGIDFLAELGVADIEEARRLPTQTIYDAYRRFRQTHPAWGLVIDGVSLPEEPTDVLDRGDQPRIPCIVGANRNEGMGTPAAKPLPESVEAFRAYVETIFADKTDEFWRLCDIHNLEDVHRVCRTEAFNFRMVGMRAYAARAAEQGRDDCYFYLFDCPIPGDDKGAFHDSELWFTFDALRRSWRPFTGMHCDMARQISGYWANFIKTGDPNGVDALGFALPAWKCAAPEDQFVMEFTTECKKETTPCDALMAYRVQYHLQHHR